MNERASLLNSIVNRKRKSLRRLPFYVIIDNLKRQNSDKFPICRFPFITIGALSYLHLFTEVTLNSTKKRVTIKYLI